MKTVCRVAFVLVLWTLMAYAECPPEVQYCSVVRNNEIKVPRGTVSVDVNCWQAEMRKVNDEEWKATGKRSQAFTGTYTGEIPGKVTDISIEGYQGERPAPWPSCTTTWSVDYEK
ncbi:MAG: hypothetical protein N2595_07815 [bacterium]|nr:hypothetical protein [bacterium]